MAAVDGFRVQPDIRAPRGFRRQLVVLRVAAADKDLKAVRRGKAHGALLFMLALFCAALLFDIACADKLGFDLGKIVLGFGALGFVKDAV